jgi:GTP-binding protein
VYLVANVQIDNLLDLYHRPHQRAKNGEKGGSRDCYGKSASDLEVPVPCGTLVMVEDKLEPLGELVNPGDRLLVAQGGRGGLGNNHFATPTNQAPMKFTEGTKGEQKVLWLELKTVADVGLVGFPNAGKSTLISRITAAHPKIGAYPFTTLYPVVGTLEYPDYKRIRIADIPGLITGAHEGIGLGYDFLRHIERTRTLMFVIDMAGFDGREPHEDFEHLLEELKLYRLELAERPHIVVANKMDLPEAREKLETFVEKTGIQPLEISAEQAKGMDDILKALYQQVFNEPMPV